jgi:hypothetical protein
LGRSIDHLAVNLAGTMASFTIKANTSTSPLSLVGGEGRAERFGAPSAPYCKAAATACRRLLHGRGNNHRLRCQQIRGFQPGSRSAKRWMRRCSAGLTRPEESPRIVLAAGRMEGREKLGVAPVFLL